MIDLPNSSMSSFPTVPEGLLRSNVHDPPPRLRRTDALACHSGNLRSPRNKIAELRTAGAVAELRRRPGRHLALECIRPANAAADRSAESGWRRRRNHAVRHAADDRGVIGKVARAEMATIVGMDGRCPRRAVIAELLAANLD